MRADESFVKRHNDKILLSEFLDRIPIGTFIAIGAWYERMAEMGLTHSHRQRLSDLRKEGYIFLFSKKLKGYVLNGKPTASNQSELFCYEGSRCHAIL